MYYSLFDIFSIGVGPSSSHTVGPMRAAKRYLENLKSEAKFANVSKVKITLYGSLALTGVGHGTLKAIIYGLMGLEAEAIDPEKPYVSAVERDKILHLGREKAISFDVDKDVVFAKDTFLPEHSNGMKLSSYDAEDNLLLEETYFSVGGGTIARQDEMSKRQTKINYNVPFQFDTCQELMEICERNNQSIYDIVMQNEV
ncbi:MAG: L-serine ammonia-lyase, partial [Alphaproteobacteria bacterium]|nr:L-serine ammonia-lyase [Alphaproteobacteria bacterium]